MTLPLPEYDALRTLYEDTDGEHWHWMLPYNTLNGYPWNFTNPFYANPCNRSYPWQGVGCILNSNGCVNVFSLKLPSYGLTGKTLYSIRFPLILF